MLKLVMLAGVMLLIAILAMPWRREPSVETVTAQPREEATPQQAYFRLHNDDELVAKP